MCIRDRYVVGRSTDVPSSESITRVVVGREIALWRAADGRLCLLYTSDAADERSSVDLGGRRLIKKKTHSKYTGT